MGKVGQFLEGGAGFLEMAITNFTSWLLFIIYCYYYYYYYYYYYSFTTVMNYLLLLIFLLLSLLLFLSSLLFPKNQVLQRIYKRLFALLNLQFRDFRFACTLKDVASLVIFHLCF